MIPRPLPPRSPARTTTARILAAVLCLVAAVPYFGVIDLVTLIGWVNPEYVWPVPLEVSWGVLFTFFLAGGYGWIAVTPKSAAPGLTALLLGGVALLAGAAAGLDPRPVPIGVAVIVSVVILALLTGTRLSALTWSVSWPHVVLSAVGALLWIPYISSALEESRRGIGREITNGVDHWPVQAAAGLAILVGAVLLAFWPSGHRMIGVAVSFAGGIIGVAVLAYPDRDGATEGMIWAILAVVWALAVASARSSSTVRRPAGEPEASEQARPRVKV
jgi:hypothetical protein